MALTRCWVLSIIGSDCGTASRIPANEIRERVIQKMKTIRLRSGDQKRLGYKLDAIELFLNRIGLATHTDHLAGLLRLQDPAPVTLYEIVTGHPLN